MRETSNELFQGRQSHGGHLLGLLLVEAWLGWRWGRRGKSAVRLLTNDNDGHGFARDVRHHVDRDALVHQMKKVGVVRRGGEKAGTVATIGKGRGAGRIHGNK